MKRIDLFMPPRSNYGVLHHFTKILHEAFQRKGVRSRLLEAKKNDPAPFLKAIFDDPPECTLSFNGLLPDDKGNFFCDMINIPHVACLVDSPTSYVPLAHSKKTIITCVDRPSIDFFKGLGASNLLFLPHAVESTLAPEKNGKRDYDVVFLGSCIDYEGLRASWDKKYSASLRKAMDNAVEIALNNGNIPYYRAFVEALNDEVNRQTGIDPEKVDFLAILDDLEMYIRGLDRIELIKAIKDAKVDIFGSGEGGGWQKYLGKQSNVTIHEAVPFEQALEIMKHTKVVLNSSPWIKYGVHERILAALACGALVITNENGYIQDHFNDGESIVLYPSRRWDKANHRVNEYLANDAKRSEVADAGRKVVMNSETWDHRAAQLIKELPPLLKKIKT